MNTDRRYAIVCSSYEQKERLRKGLKLLAVRHGQQVSDYLMNLVQEELKNENLN